MHLIMASLILLVFVLPIAAEQEPYIRVDFDFGSRSQADPNGGQSVTIADLSMYDNGDEWFAMPSFQFNVKNSARSIRTSSITFAKTMATRSESGRVIWHGKDSNSTAEATLLRDPGGEVAGFLSEGSFLYEMIQTHDGLVRMVMAPADTVLPTTEDVESSRSALSFLQDVFSASDDAVGEIPPSFLAKTVDIDVGPYDPPITCDPEVDHGAVVDVLLVVTHDAMCYRADVASPCDLEAHRGSMDRALAIAEARTNQAMQAVGLQVYIEFVDTVYIAPGFQTPATGTTLRFVGYSEDILRRRNQVGSDLVAFIGTDDPQGDICGKAQIQGAHSITSASAICLFRTLIHELGHNFGCMHHESDTFFDGLRGGYLFLNFFGYGYENEETFHTIMSYGCEDNYCRAIPYFSSDRCTYDGAKMGDQYHNSARLIRSTAPGISKYRKRKDVTGLAAEITLFDTPSDGLQCHPHKAGVCEYGQSLVHYNFLWLICFQRCVDDNDSITDFSFGIDWLEYALDWVLGELLCGPCDALINF